jgi:hypothetical protein
VKLSLNDVARSLAYVNRLNGTFVNVVTVETSPVPVIVPPADDHRRMRGIIDDFLYFDRRC